ncbi:MAG: FHA domain-containing protein [Polyangiaceae bacterium]|jgi:two-component sensor histidine kinase|nr:FHA domain-containing protein [Polyangiaceae bacterium]
MDNEASRRRFIEHTIAAQEDERARISRELHDGIGQALTSLLVGLRTLESTLASDHGARTIAAQLREVTAAAMDEISRIARGLRPPALDDLGLEAALKHLASDVAARHALRIDQEMTGAHGGVRLPPSVEIAVYRIVQEALNNIVKHADATAASVVIETRESSVRVIVEDNGRGMPGEVREGGFGLQSIRERVGLFAGAMTIESTPAQGTTLFVTIPVQRQAPSRFWLRFQGSQIPLAPGEYVIGRSSECDVVVADPRASRQHARIVVSEHGAVIQDLDSANGVFLNGKRLRGREKLAAGDAVLIGEEPLLVEGDQGMRAPTSAVGWNPTEKTLPGKAAVIPSSRRRVETAGLGEGEVTKRADALQMMGAIAARLVEAGRPGEAERILSGHLRAVRDAVSAGDEVPGAMLDIALGHALTLAEATADARWVQFAMRLFEEARRALPNGAVARLAALADHAAGDEGAGGIGGPRTE